MKSVLKGVERHLSSPIEKMRTLGMIVGETLMNLLQIVENKDKMLKFEVKFNSSPNYDNNCFLDF